MTILRLSSCLGEGSVGWNWDRSLGGGCGRGGLCLARLSKDCDVVKERRERLIYPAILHPWGVGAGGRRAGELPRNCPWTGEQRLQGQSWWETSFEVEEGTEGTVRRGTPRRRRTRPCKLRQEPRIACHLYQRALRVQEDNE